MTYTMKDLGCYFDGAYGFEYNAKRVIDFAIEYHGYVLQHYENDIDSEDIEVLVWEADDAEAHLNDNTERPSNAHWGWENGDFGLWLYCEQCYEVTDEDYTCCKEE